MDIRVSDLGVYTWRAKGRWPLRMKAGYEFCAANFVAVSFDGDVFIVDNTRFDRRKEKSRAFRLSSDCDVSENMG